MERINSKEEIKVAHIIIAHQFPEQLKRLINALQHPQVFFFIHIDKKSDQQPFLTILKGFENVRFIQKRTDITWGGFSMVEAMLQCFREVKGSSVPFTHVNLLSGADYPVKKADEFITYLAKNPYEEYFEYYPAETEWTEAITRYTRYHLTEYKFKGKYLAEKALNFLLPKRKVPYNLEMVGRLQWFTITYELMCYFLDTVSQKKKLLSFFKLTWGIDELFLPTLTYNSEYRSKMVNHPLRYIQFNEGQSHPTTIGMADWDILQNEKYFFSRKFDINNSSDLMDRIDREILNNN